MENDLVSRILSAYCINGALTSSSQKGYRNVSTPITLKDGTALNLILYKREPGILAKIRDANHIGNVLAAQGFPARKTHSDKIISIRSSDGTREQYGGLYEYLPGATIPWEAYTRAHIRSLGKTMADMHVLLKEERVTTDCIDEYQAIIARMRRYFADENVQAAMARKLRLSLSLESFKQGEKALLAARQLPAQALHMDFVRGNVLFGEADKKALVSGVIDFEKVANGPRILDIARTFAFLLVDCKYKEEAVVRHAFLQAGYLRRSAYATIRHGDFDLLEELIDMFLLYDFYKFLRHNPYEFLLQNGHFIRTRDFLQKRQHLMDMKPAQHVV